MIKKIMSLSLRRQMVILFTIITLLVMLTQSFYIISILKKNTEQNTENCYNIIRQTDSMLSAVADRIATTGRAVSDNEYIQELLYLNISKEKDDLQHRMELMGFLFNYLDGIIEANDELSDIVLIDNNENIISASNHFNYLNYQRMKEEYDFEKIKTGQFTHWYDFGSGWVISNGFGYMIPVYYTTGEFSSNTQRLGTIIIWCNENSLVEVADTTAATEASTVLIVDTKSCIMALNSKYTINQASEEMDKLLRNHANSNSEENIQEMKFMNQDSFVLIKEHQDTGWKSINIVPKKGVYKETLRIFYQGMIFAVIAIIILLVFGIYMIHGITRPLVQITTVLDSIGNGNRKNRINVLEKNEFGIIGDSVNNMLDNVENMNHRIFDMQSKLYEKELIQKEAEMLTLQSQINPHFLYNTLECIRSIAVVYKMREIPVITTSMANIFRYSIKGGVMATIKQELDCINDYYKIISIRYNERLKIFFDVDERLLSYSMLKMTLQPIIENSVYHGLEATEDEVQISIKGWIEGEYVYFTIYDNGAGMDQLTEQTLNDAFDKATTDEIAEVGKSKSSIGLTNINARVKLHYGKEYGLFVESTRNIGTKVTMKIKLLNEL